jgi:hypothetical protein
LVKDDKVVENMKKLQILRDNNEIWFTPTNMRMTNKWKVWGFISTFVGGIVLMLAGIAMIELLYIGLALVLSCIIVWVVYKYRSYPRKPYDGQFCIMNLENDQNDQNVFYEVYYSTRNEVYNEKQFEFLAVVTIWKYKFDNLSSWTYSRVDGEFEFKKGGAIDKKCTGNNNDKQWPRNPEGYIYAWKKDAKHYVEDESFLNAWDITPTPPPKQVFEYTQTTNTEDDNKVNN